MHKRGLDRVGFATLHEGTVTAVASRRTTPDERQSALPASRSTWLIRLLERDGQRATLAALYGLATGTDPQSANRLVVSTLTSKIFAALESGRLLLLIDGVQPHSPARPPGASDSPEQRLVSSVLGGQSVLSFKGVSYRLVAVDSGTILVGHVDYMPVPPTDAAALVKRMAVSFGSTPAQRSLWDGVSEAIARSDDQPRILLMRPRPGAAPPPADEAPAPKAQRAPVAGLSWIELQIEFEDGTPYPGNCVVEVPGGVQSEGPPDDKGTIRIDRINPGSSKVSFPDLDAATWDPA